MILALTSVTGAPGTTTTALALLFAWPRPVILLEADISRPSALLSGYYRGGTEGGWGLPALIRAAHADALTIETVMQQVRPLAEGQLVIVGLESTGQAEGARHYWSSIAATLTAVANTGWDLIIDAGRFGPSCPAPLLAAADLLAVVSGTRLPDVDALQDAAGTLTALFGDGGARTVGALITRPGQPLPAPDTAHATGLPLLSTIAEDATAAAFLSSGEAYRDYDKSRLARSAAQTAAHMLAMVSAARERLGLLDPATEGGF